MSVRGGVQTAIGWLILAYSLFLTLGHAEEVDRSRFLDVRPTPDPLEGYWLARDPDGVVSTRSVIRIYRRSGRLHGRIVLTMSANGDQLTPVCERCPGDLKGRPFSDFDFIRDLRPSGKAWTGGSVIDLRPGPLQGILASCDLTLQNDDTAVLHGYLGLRWLGRSSIWTRYIEP